MKTLLKSLAVMLVVSCAGCYWPSERAVYGVACQALANDPATPKGAVPRSISEAVLAVGKSAARVDLPFDVAGPGGKTDTKWLVVWCKRIERRWEFDRAYQRQVYPAGP
jgi:hypothetical protein